MSDFSVHPVLKSPFVAGVVCAAVTFSFFDIGFSEVLVRGGESTIDAGAWADLVSARWVAAGISFGMAALGWFVLFRASVGQIAQPWAGILAGALGTIGGAFLIAKLYQSTGLPEFAAGHDIIWRVAALWCFLIAIIGLGCLRFGVQSYRILRGRA